MKTFLLMIASLLALGAVVWLIAWLVRRRRPVWARRVAAFLSLASSGVALGWFGSGWLARGSLGRRVLGGLLAGHRNSALLYVAARLGLADLLASGPRSSAELANSLGAHAASLHRVLRGLVTLGVCSEERDGRFGLAALGAWLRADTPGSLRGHALLCGEESVGAWGDLLHSVMTGETAFNHVFGMSQWEHRGQHPELSEYFNAEQERGTARAAAAIVAAYDFSPFRTIADVGGGRGTLLAAILKACPAAAGILFDQPHVVAGAGPYLEAAGVAARCQVVGGSFFDRVPAGADVLVLKSIIHDWDDEHALVILRNCRVALGERGTLLVVERLMPTRAEDEPAAVLTDLHMLAVTGGRERSEAEYRTLFEGAGLTVTRILPTRSSACIIEGVPRR